MRLRSAISRIGCAAAAHSCSRGRATSAFSRSMSAMKCSNYWRGAVSTPANPTACSARERGSLSAIFRLRSAKLPMVLPQVGCLTACGSRESGGTFWPADTFSLGLHTSFFGRSGLECVRKMLLGQRVMTLTRMMAPAKRGTLVAVAVAAAALALAEPSAAQYWGGGDRYYGGG